MVPLVRLIRLEPILTPVKAHTRGNRRVPKHLRASQTQRFKAWYWTPRGYFTKIIVYGKRRRGEVRETKI